MTEAGDSLRKFLKNVLLLVIGIVVGLMACLTTYYVSGGIIFEKTVGSRSMPASARAEATNAELSAYAYKILAYIKAGDYETLSQVVHPEFGVVFSPYATISLSSNKCFTPSQVATFANNKNQYVWGKYDGSGNPIEMTPPDYFKKFVFDRDYTVSPQTGVDAIVRSGNSLENIREVFPNVRFVDFHFPGTEKYSGIDWSSLRLGFEKYNGELKLTAVVHSIWTV